MPLKMPQHWFGDAQPAPGRPGQRNHQFRVKKKKNDLAVLALSLKHLEIDDVQKLTLQQWQRLGTHPPLGFVKTEER